MSESILKMKTKRLVKRKEKFMSTEIVYEDKPIEVELTNSDFEEGTVRCYVGTKNESGNICHFFRAEWFGVSYFLRQDMHDDTLYIVYDIEVEEGQDKLDLFQSIDRDARGDFIMQLLFPNCKNIIVDIENNNRTYPSVETLLIGAMIQDMHIRNSQFPSINKIIGAGYGGAIGSVSGRFLLKKIRQHGIYEGSKLINTLGAIDGHGGLLYFGPSLEIADYALSGVSVSALTPAPGLRIVLNSHSFDGCLDAAPDINGVIASGGFILDVSPDVSCVEIGNSMYSFLNTYLIETGKVKRVIVDTYRFPQNDTTYAEAIASIVSKFSGKAEVILRITNPLGNVSDDFFRKLAGCKFNRVETVYDGYVINDGIVYSKDGKTVVYSNDVSGSLVIPEGVETIGTDAFSHSNVSSVSLPSTIKNIQTSAFYCAKNLKSISLPEGLCEIGSSAFRGTGISAIKIPMSCTYIGKNALDGICTIAAYPGNGVKITSIFRDLKDSLTHTIIDAETGKRYAFAAKTCLSNASDKGFFDYFDLAWQNNDMDMFAKDAARVYAYTSRNFQPVRIRLAVLSFVYGYADEEGARYAKDHVFDFLTGCIDDKNEGLAIEALKTPGLVSKAMFKKVLPKFIDAGMSEAAAVITEQTVPKTKKTSITL